MSSTGKTWSYTHAHLCGLAVHGVGMHIVFVTLQFVMRAEEHILYLSVLVIFCWYNFESLMLSLANQSLFLNSFLYKLITTKV